MHPAAPGREPQQAVSVAEGSLLSPLMPDAGEEADRSLRRRVLLQEGHLVFSSRPRTSCSQVLEQSRHRYS